MTAAIQELEAEPILIDGLTWREFKATEQLLDRPGVRLSFLDGVLEIRKMPGKKHETVKRRISTLLDNYLEYAGIDYTPTGSMTLESAAGLVKREADDSYELGPGRERPDLAIEIVITSSGIRGLSSNGTETYAKAEILSISSFQASKMAHLDH